MQHSHAFNCAPGGRRTCSGRLLMKRYMTSDIFWKL